MHCLCVLLSIGAIPLNVYCECKKLYYSPLTGFLYFYNDPDCLLRQRDFPRGGITFLSSLHILIHQTYCHENSYRLERDKSDLYVYFLKNKYILF